jgi:hypothetical protein
MLKPTILGLTLILISFTVFLHAQETTRHADHRNPSIEKTRYIMLIDEAHQKQLPAPALSASSKSFAAGNIAVIPANLRTLIPVNEFDLYAKKVSFIPVPSGGYTVQVSPGEVSDQRGTQPKQEKLDFGSGFRFPFYGKKYSSVYIRKCGDLAFEPTSGSCGDLVSAYSDAPRIIATNYPGSFCSPTNIYIQRASDHFTVTYDFTYDCDYYSPRQFGTFQINLFRNGTIEFLSKGSIYTGGSSLTGISPGGLELKDVRMTDYSNTPSTQIDSHTAVFERFADVANIDFEALLQQFHNQYKDDYDFVTIFTDQFYTDRYYPNSGFEFLPVQNSTRGIGLPVFNYSEKFGNPRLKSVILMDSADQLPDNPKDPLLLTMNTLQLMGHLIGRTWAPYAGVVINGKRKNDLVGQRPNTFYSGLPFSTQAWNFYMDTDASLLGGNEIKENGDGTFTTIDATKRYSKLDQYLMGLIPATAVPPFFFVRADSADPRQAPRIGQTFSGQKVNLQINQVIEANNVPRTPSSETSQKQFKNAFIYFISAESTADSRQLAKIERIRTDWEKFFKAATNQHATIDTTLKKGNRN